MRWHWEKVDPSRNGMGGDLSKMFKNETVKTPGMLAVNAPDPAAVLMTREVIQNSWDSALDHRREYGTADPFAVRFKFRRETGKRREATADLLGLAELAQRAAQVASESDGKGGVPGSVARIAGDSTLGLLEIIEQAGGGMHGPWEGDQSKLWVALCSMGITPKRTGGGSYGFGKAGLIRGSTARTVIAYTCFPEQSDDSGVTRRLLGMTYWGSHRIAGISYAGYGRLGKVQSDGVVVPFENNEADETAEALGLAVRHPGVADDRGSTFLLVQPTVGLADVIASVERYWWAALLEQSLKFSVVAEDERGIEHMPKPLDNEALRSFHDARLVAADEGASREDGQERRRVVLHRVGGFSSPGVVGLVSDSEGWSHPDAQDGVEPVEHRSLVALMREPRMVVEYLEAGKQPPFVRGVFVADPSADDALRQTEPKAHDEWQVVPSDDVPKSCTDLAGAVQKRIKTAVTSFRKALEPPAPPIDELRMPEFDRIMKDLLSGDSAVPAVSPDPTARPYSIIPGGQVQAGDNGLVRLIGTAWIGFNEDFDPAPCSGHEVVVSIGYRYLEDDRDGDLIGVRVKPPAFFSPNNGNNDGICRFRGNLTKGVSARFDYESEQYDPTWTGTLSVAVDPAKDDGSGEDADSETEDSP